MSDGESFEVDTDVEFDPPAEELETPAPEESDEEIAAPETPMSFLGAPMTERTEGISMEKPIYIAPREEWRTSDLLSEFEMTELVGIRASQIERDPSCAMIDIGDLDDCIKIAQRELMERRCPLIKRRPTGTIVINGITHIRVEDRNPREMQFSIAY